MDCRSYRWNRVASAWLIGGGLVLGALGCHHKPKPSQAPPNIDALREALQRTATVAFPSPSLVNRRFSLALAPDRISSKAVEIAKIGSELKGTVLSSPSSSSGASILISLPQNRLAEFANRALGQSIPPENEPDREVLVEITITSISSIPAEGASPASK